MSALEIETLDDVCVELSGAIAALRVDVHDVALQRAVCLAGRSVDSVFFTDSLFDSMANRPVDHAGLMRVKELLKEAIQVLPEGSKYWQSVSDRYDELEVYFEKLSRGDLFDPTTLARR